MASPFRVFSKALRSPGAMRDVLGTAPTQLHIKSDPELKTTEDLKQFPGHVLKAKPGTLDRALDWLVRASGSAPVFLCIQAVLVTWAFLGIPFHDVSLWPIAISDAQAILSYVFDSFLMRQQFNGYYESLDVAAELQSRSDSTRRMLRQVQEELGSDIEHVITLSRGMPLVKIQLPQQDLFGRMVNWMGIVFGHILFVALYLLSILLWLGFGHYRGWDSQWQLDINSATSALMVFIFSFLAILRERHASYINSCLDAIHRVDAALETKLRSLTKDDIPNAEVHVPAAKVSAIQRAINYYADIVGALTGVVILILVFIVWLAIGPILHFDSNWWLAIGTYAGLIGLNDGFVLRNVLARLRDHEEPQYTAIDAADVQLFQSLGLAAPSAPPVDKETIGYRVSERMGRICGHEITVLCGVLLIIGLLVGASLMGWSETGQLLCNIPPSIVESFFMIILITGHNSADAQRRVDLTNIFERRRVLLSVADAVRQWSTKSGLQRRHDEALDLELARAEAFIKPEQSNTTKTAAIFETLDTDQH